MRGCGRGQADQGKVLDNYCHVTSALGALRSGPKGYVITIASFFERELNKHRNVERKNENLVKNFPNQ